MVLYSTIFYFSQIWPEYENQFIEIALLGKSNKTTEYFDNVQHVIYIGTPIRWSVYVHNYRSESSLIRIVVRLLNSTNNKPDDLSGTPGDGQLIKYHNIYLEKNEKNYITIDWSILNEYYNVSNNCYYIDSIIYNDGIINFNKIPSKNGEYFMVFELWVWDAKLNDFRYGYNINSDFRSSSLYMQFNIINNYLNYR